jgi:rare lipoprotein A (peptidoglycan hydrolase)
MHIDVRTKTTALLALAAGVLCLSAPAMSAAAEANAGGVGAPTSTPSATAPATPTPATPKVHPVGIATWFGPGFFGKETACGQTLTPAVVGVANRTLPCGTLVKVSFGTHTLVVPVIDRGPYSKIGASWDLTAGAAEALGITETVRIHTHVVGSTPDVPTLGLPAASPASTLTGGAEAG